MDITSAAAAGAIASATACPSCVFGAYSSRILSFTSSYIEHITVSVTPHITVYTNGSRSTSFESDTLTKSSVVGGIEGTNSSKTYARKSDIRWTVDGVTLTYPTKYVQYLGFKGAPVPTDSGDSCAGKTAASEISLPATTNAASFIYALPANATSLSLPTQLLSYLGGLDDLADQFDGASLSGCAPLEGGVLFGASSRLPYKSGSNTSVEISSSVIPHMSSGYIEGTGTSSSAVYTSQDSATDNLTTSRRPGTTSSQASLTSRMSILPHLYLNTSSSGFSSSSSTRSASESSSLVPEDSTSISQTSEMVWPTGYIPSVDNGEQPPPTSTVTTHRPPPKGSPDSPPAHDDGDDDDDDQSIPSSIVESYTAPAYTTAPNDEGVNDHTTAFVIEAITGQAVITYQATPTPNAGSGGKTSTGGEKGTGSTDVSNLLDQIDAIANGKQENVVGSGSSNGGSNDSGAPSDGKDGQNNIGDSDSSNGDLSGPGVSLGDDDATNDGGSDSERPNSSSENTSGPDSPSGADDGLSYAQQSEEANDVDVDPFSGQSPDSAEGLDLISAIDSVAHQASPDASPAPVYSGDSTVLTAQPNGVVVIEGQTVAPGQSITVGSGPSTTIVALQTNRGNTELLFGDNTLVAVPGSAVTAQSDGAVVYEGSTVQPGQSLTLGSGSSATIVALQTDGSTTNFVVGDTTMQVLPAGSRITAAPEAATGPASMALITTNGQTVTAIQSGDSLILQSGSSTATVAAGIAGTFAGETFVAVPTEGAVFVNGAIMPLTAAEGVQGASQAVITADRHIVTAIDAGKSVLLVDDSMTKTLQDGAEMVFQSQTFSAEDDGMAIVVNGRTTAMSSAMAFATGQAVVTAGGSTFSVLDLPGYVILQDGSTSMTIRDGATATFEGQAVTALRNGDAVVVDGKTLSLTEPVTFATAQAVLTARGHTFTAFDKDGYIILQDGSSTLTVHDGQTATYDGQIVRALTSGVVVNGKTQSFTSVEATPTDDMGRYIEKGVGGDVESTSSQTVDVAVSGPTAGAENNSAYVLSTSMAAVMVALSIVGTLLR